MNPNKNYTYSLNPNFTNQDPKCSSCESLRIENEMLRRQLHLMSQSIILNSGPGIILTDDQIRAILESPKGLKLISEKLPELFNKYLKKGS